MFGRWHRLCKPVDSDIPKSERSLQQRRYVLCQERSTCEALVTKSSASTSISKKTLSNRAAMVIGPRKWQHAPS
jgi:hypothetical protein